MKPRRPRINKNFLIIVPIALVVFAAAQSAYGQKAAPQRDMSGAEQNVRAMEIGASTPKDSKTIITEVNEDFDRIRAINEEVKTATSSNTSLSYKSISDSAVEIKKRATRLKANLTGLPKADKEEKHQKQNVPLDEAQMRSLLSSLNGVMTSFLSNPVFSDMGTLDNQLAFKARRDLEALIELSDVVKKGAEKLGKRAGQ
jgi:hypothetical protein